MDPISCNSRSLRFSDLLGPTDPDDINLLQEYVESNGSVAYLPSSTVKSHPMNGILLSWTIYTHLVMGSLHGPMTLMRDLPLILTLMSLGITLKGQYKLSVFWMTLHLP